MTARRVLAFLVALLVILVAAGLVMFGLALVASAASAGLLVFGALCCLCGVALVVFLPGAWRAARR